MMRVARFLVVFLALFVVVSSASSAQVEKSGRWRIERWEERDLSGPELLAKKLPALAESLSRPEVLASQVGELQPSFETIELSEWLAATVRTAGPVDFHGVWSRLVGFYGEETSAALLARIRIRGGRIERADGSSRYPSTWTISAFAWSWFQPVQHVTKTRISSRLLVTAGDDQAIHAAMRLSRETYGDGACGDWYQGEAFVCPGVASAQNGQEADGSCGRTLVEDDCGDGNIAKAVVRITIVDLDENGLEVPGTLQFVDDQRTSLCATADCDCGVDFEP